MKKCKIGIIGAGGIAQGIHLPVLSELADVEIAAVCDIRRNRAESAAKKFNIPKIYNLYHDMLKSENIDVVYVLTEPEQMFRVASDCMNAGKHVFMEKPMGITAFQANSLRETAIKNKKILDVGYNRRYIPLVIEIVSQMRKLTKINQISGYFYKNSTASFYGGCASSFVCDVIHVIDLVRHIAVGGESGNVSQVSTLETVNPKTNVPESWYSTMKFDDGINGIICANYNAGGRVHKFELHGVGASAYINLGFGDSGCDGRILCDGASFSIVSEGGGNKQIQEFDGIKIAGSDRYENYYGYRDEDIAFVNKVLENPAETDIARVNEDYYSMKLAETLLNSRK
ncbi:MAG: Gfo/Idh/MocA family oxidoreductase [Oscillospiraceae bacterium]|nr:Gfo/Idh/MocA family oxidoreductase [Oscillospiraceae bacterium]